MHSYNEVHKENSREIAAKNWGWRALVQRLQKNPKKRQTKFKQTNQEMGLNYLWKPMIWKLEGHLYQRMKIWNSFSIDVSKSRILAGFKMEKGNFWQGVIRGGCRSTGPVCVTLANVFHLLVSKTLGGDAALARLQLELLPSALGTPVCERRWKGPRTQHHEREVWKMSVSRGLVHLEWRRLGKCDSNFAQKSHRAWHLHFPSCTTSSEEKRIEIRRKL